MCVHYYHQIFRTHSGFPVVPIMPVRKNYPVQNHSCLACFPYSGTVFHLSFDLDNSRSVKSATIPFTQCLDKLDSFEDQRPIILSFSWACLMLSYNEIQAIHCWKEQHGSDAVFFSLYLIRLSMIHFCSITDNVHIDQLIHVVFASLPHCNGIILPFVKSDIFWADTLKSRK